MKKIALLLVVMILGAATSFAQPNIDPQKAEDIFNARVKMFTEQLKLTPEQTVKFIPVYKNYLDKVRSIKRPDRTPQTGNINQATQFCKSHINYKRNILNAQEAMINDLKSILNPTQLVQFMKVENSVQHKIRNAKNRKNDKRFNDRRNGPKAHNGKGCNNCPNAQNA